MRDLYRAYPATCKPLGEVTEAAMRGPSPFTQGQRELIAAYVSGLNACEYCHGTHVAVAEACGVTPDLIKALLADIETAPIEPRMKPILKYAKKLTLAPARITEVDAATTSERGNKDFHPEMAPSYVAQKTLGTQNSCTASNRGLLKLEAQESGASAADRPSALRSSRSRRRSGKRESSIKAPEPLPTIVTGPDLPASAARMAATTTSGSSAPDFSNARSIAARAGR